MLVQVEKIGCQLGIVGGTYLAYDDMEACLHRMFCLAFLKATKVVLDASHGLVGPYGPKPLWALNHKPRCTWSSPTWGSDHMGSGTSGPEAFEH